MITNRILMLIQMIIQRFFIEIYNQDLTGCKPGTLMNLRTKWVPTMFTVRSLNKLVSRQYHKSFVIVTANMNELLLYLNSKEDNVICN